MKIRDIETVVVALPPRRPHPMAFGGAGLGRYVLVTVRTDEGIDGIGEATSLVDWGGDYGRYFGESPETVVTMINTVLTPALLGADPFAIERAHTRMDRATKGHFYAKAAIDMALHDIKGKALGVPVYELLGGLFRSEVPIAHSLGLLDLDTALSEVAQALAEGVRTIKVKIGLDAARDVRVVRAVRKEVGPDIDIVVDANQGYPNCRAAIAAILRFEEEGVRYVEQPVEGLRHLAHVTSASGVAIVADESAWTAYDVLDIALQNAADGVSLYTTKPGGLWPAKRAAAVIEAAGLFANVNGSAETGVGNAANLHLAASTPCVTEACVLPVTRLEGVRPTEIAGAFYLDDVITQPFEFKDGCLVVPSGPGLGVELDSERIKRYTVA